MPTLSAPCVAADAELQGCRFWDNLMKSLKFSSSSATLMLAKDGLTQVFENRWASVLKSRRPLIVFLKAAEAAADGTYFALALGVFVP